MDSPKNTTKLYYTLCLDIENKKCVVVGGGAAARHKAAAMKDHRAKITVISDKLDSVLEYMAFQKEIDWVQREFIAEDVEGAFIVVAASDSHELNYKVSEVCKGKNILCNVSDSPEESSFITPSVIERGPLTIAISTGGLNPTLAASIRRELEFAYGEEYGTFLELISNLRIMILEEFSSQQSRTYVYERMITSRALSLLRSGLIDEARKELENVIYTSRSILSKEKNIVVDQANQPEIS